MDHSTAASPGIAGDPGPHARRLALAVAVACALGTALVATVPGLPLAWRGVEAHVAIEAIVTVVGVLLAALLAGRAQRTGSRDDALLAASLTVLALSNALFAMVPSVVGAGEGNFRAWASVGGRLVGAVLLAAAAVAPDRRMASPRRGTVAALAGAVGATALVAALSWAAAGGLPAPPDPATQPGGGDRVSLGSPGLVAVDVAAVALYAAAAAGFLRTRRLRRDGLALWLGLAAIAGAFARLDYLLFPSLAADWVYAGDLLRLTSYLVLFAGAVHEILGYQRRAAEQVVLDERRRLARDLHDGLAQEAAFIARETMRLEPSRHAERIRQAADRALAESRLAILALSGDSDAPLGTLLRQAAESVAVRAGARVAVETAGEPATSPEARRALMRIVREAAANAVEHGSAEHVTVRVQTGPPARVVVRDDGCGFDPGTPARGDAFGLTSMAERAEGIGASLDVRSRPGAGTIVEVTLP